MRCRRRTAYTTQRTSTTPVARRDGRSFGQQARACPSLTVRRQRSTTWSTGAEGADVHTGDGAGIPDQVPDEFFREVCEFEAPR